MSSAAKIDFENYFALLVTSLERFSIPGLGSFVWHIERVEIDPKAAQIKPPRPQLKFEPGQRYVAGTVAFLVDRYGLAPEEAEAFLRELGQVLAAYLKATTEMDVWKLGKLRRVGVSYRLELNEEASLSFLEDLLPVSLRYSEGAVAPIAVSKSSPAPSKKTEKEKTSRESSRARSVEVPPQPSDSPSPKRRGLAWIGVIFLILVGIAVGAYFILRKRESTAREPVEVVLGTREKASRSTQTSEMPSKSESAPSADKPSASPPRPESKSAPQPPPSESSKPTAPPREPAPSGSTPAQPSPTRLSPPSTPSPASSGLITPQKGYYYIIVGSYPSLAEAQEKAKVLGSPTVEFLPGKEGRVRVSYYSSPDKAVIQARLQEVKARIPDAWVYTP